MKKNRPNIKSIFQFGGERTIWVCFIFLCIISVIEMFSASSQLVSKPANYTEPIIKHILFLMFGIVLVLGLHRIPYKIIHIGSYIGLAVLLPLLFILAFHISISGVTVQTNEAWRWIHIPFSKEFTFQPSEWIKPCLIIVVAHLLSHIKNSKTNEKRYFWWIIGITVVICLLIARENGSTALLLGTVVFLMLFIAQISLKRIGMVVGFLVLVVALVVVFPSIFPRAATWKNRLTKVDESKITYTSLRKIDYVNSKGDTIVYRMYDGTVKDERGRVRNVTNRQVMHGKIAVAQGFPLGVLPGNSTERDQLPLAYADMIFAIIIEELGLVGGILVILAYLIPLWHAGNIACRSQQVFPAMMAFGLTVILAIQAFISMAVAINLHSRFVTGQTLPLISNGGTSIVATCAYFGVILGVTRQIKKEQGLQPAITVPETLPEVSLDDDD